MNRTNTADTVGRLKYLGVVVIIILWLKIVGICGWPWWDLIILGLALLGIVLIYAICEKWYEIKK